MYYTSPMMKFWREFGVPTSADRILPLAS